MDKVAKFVNDLIVMLDKDWVGLEFLRGISDIVYTHVPLYNPRSDVSQDLGSETVER